MLKQYDDTNKTVTEFGEIEEWSLPPKFLQFLIGKLLEASAERLPAYGRFRPVEVSFYIPETENLGFLEIEDLGLSEPNMRILKTTVVRKGTDYAYNHFLKKGSSAEIKNYLTDMNSFQELYESLHKLSDQVEAYWADA